MSKICSTATAPPSQPHHEQTHVGQQPGQTSPHGLPRDAPPGQPPRGSGPHPRFPNAPGNRSSTNRPSTAPAGNPSASAGNTTHRGPYHPSAGNHPSCTPTTVASTDAVRNSGSAASTAEPVPPACSAERGDRRRAKRHGRPARTTEPVPPACSTEPGDLRRGKRPGRPARSAEPVPPASSTEPGDLRRAERPGRAARTAQPVPPACSTERGELRRVGVLARRRERWTRCRRATPPADRDAPAL